MGAARDLLLGIREAMFAERGSAAVDGPDAARRFAEIVAASASPDFTVTMSGGAMTTTYDGRDGFAAGWADFVAPFDSISIVPEQVRENDAGDCVVEFVHLVGRPKGTDAEIDQDAAAVWRVRDGRLVAVEFHMDRDAALRSGGIDPNG